MAVQKPVKQIGPQGEGGTRLQPYTVADGRASLDRLQFNDLFVGGVWTLAEGGEVIAKFAPEDVARLTEVEPGVSQWLDGNGRPIEGWL